MQKRLEVCFSPALFDIHANPEANCVIIDVLRATSSLCTALMNGAKSLIPVSSTEMLLQYKSEGYVVAGERDGITLDFADFGNSPSNFSRANIEGKTVIYTTTNGTKSIVMASGCHSVTIGSYLNFSALCKWLEEENRDVLLFCAGWKNRFNLEDTLLAGAMCKRLLSGGRFFSECDSVAASLDLWHLAEPDIMGYVEKAAQRGRLRQKRLDDILVYCHTFDLTRVIPILQGNALVAIDRDLQLSEM